MHAKLIKTAVRKKGAAPTPLQVQPDAEASVCKIVPWKSRFPSLLRLPREYTQRGLRCHREASSKRTSHRRGGEFHSDEAKEHYRFSIRKDDSAEARAVIQGRVQSDTYAPLGLPPPRFTFYLAFASCKTYAGHYFCVYVTHRPVEKNSTCCYRA